MDVIEGNKAKEFCLPSDTEGDITLDNYKGNKVVLYFYPKDSTSGCTIEAIDFSERIDEFTKLNVTIIGASKDSIKSHIKFREKYNLKITLISDESCELFENYGSWVEKSMYGRKYMGINRDTFLIDENGMIIKIWRKVKVKNHAQEVLDYISNF